MANPYYRGPVSDHFDGERFYNVGGATNDKGLSDVLRWKLLGRTPAWSGDVPAIIPAVPPAQSDALRVTMVGHACVLIQLGGVNLLVDPLWSERAGPRGLLGPRRVDPPGVAFSDLPKIDAVLITHNHYDHLDAASIRRLHAAHRPRFLTPLGNDTLLRKVAADIDVASGDWGATFDVGGVRITVHPAHHWSARTGRDRRMALWSGFVIAGSAASVYVAGDTAYGDGTIFRDVAERHGAPTLAVLPIGAYEPRWFMRNQHVNPAEAVRILQDCRAVSAIGVHWGSFRLTDEPREAPLAALATALASAGIAADRFRPVRPGDVWQASRG